MSKQTIHHNFENIPVVHDQDNGHHIRLRKYDFQQRTTPDLFEQMVTTTTTTTINKEVNSKVDEMTTTHLEKSPIRRVNLVTGPNSAFARLFPERYRQEQEQEQWQRHQRSKSSDTDQRYNFDRTVNIDQSMSNLDDEKQTIRRSNRVTFDDQQQESTVPERTKSESYLNESIDRFSSHENTLNYDAEPEIIYRDNPEKLVYIQKVGVRYLKPPTPSPPGPLIIREVQATPPEEPPPLIVTSSPPMTPRTPSPLIVREQPPSPPPPQPTKVITKTLPPPPTPPRRVIFKRVPPLPAKPRPLIIEKWLPYKDPPERKVLYERATQKQPATNQPRRNLILQYQPANVKIEQEIQNVGCFRVDPDIYRAQFGSTLRRTASIRQVLESIGCNPDLITSTGCLSSTMRSRPNTTCFTDQQLSELIASSQSTIPSHS